MPQTRRSGRAAVTRSSGAAPVDGRLAQLAPETLARLDAVLRPAWSRYNPVDLIGDAPGRRYAGALSILFDDHGVDAVLALNCPTAVASSVEAARACRRWSRRPERHRTSHSGAKVRLGSIPVGARQPEHQLTLEPQHLRQLKRGAVATGHLEGLVDWRQPCTLSASHDRRCRRRRHIPRGLCPHPRHRGEPGITPWVCA